MREVVFRGKTYDGMWIEGVYYHANKNYGDPDDVHCIIPTTETLDYEQALEYFPVDPVTVGQYTGLKDMNGKQIFEGDIVEGVCYNEDDGYGVVKWDDGAFIVSNNDWCGSFVENYYGEMFKIIGNIHDNPELIEVR